MSMYPCLDSAIVITKTRNSSHITIGNYSTPPPSKMAYQVGSNRP